MRAIRRYFVPASSGESASKFPDRVCKAQYPPDGAGCGTRQGSERNKIQKRARDKFGIRFGREHPYISTFRKCGRRDYRRVSDSVINNAKGGNVIMKVFLVWFVPQGGEEEDDGLLIGVYESGAAAEAAIQRLRTKPGFVDSPQGFQIHSRELGQDSWTEGFVRD